MDKAKITSEQRVKEVELEVEAIEKALEQKKKELTIMKWMKCDGCKWFSLQPGGASCRSRDYCSRSPFLKDLFDEGED